MIRHTFGPVPSRRLGISLGVDIIPYKTCTLDCVYCECGKTTDSRITRSSFVDPELILSEIEEVVSGDQLIEYITFSGSGEPTLNIDIGRIIRGIKKMTDVPVAVLTNGTLFPMKDVRDDLLEADLVLPSLDAVSPSVFSKINLPHGGLDIVSIIEGLVEFRKEYSGRIWLEVFIAKGLNDGEEELEKIYAAIKRIRPDRVQLNSLDRPPAYENIEPVTMDVLEAILEKWKYLPVEIIKRIRKRDEIASFSKNLESNILNTIKRRPLTIEDLEALTGKTRLELFKYIDVLEREKRVHTQVIDNKIFFLVSTFE